MTECLSPPINLVISNRNDTSRLLKRSIFDCSNGSGSFMAPPSPIQPSYPGSSTPGERKVLPSHYGDSGIARTPQKKHKAEVHQTPAPPSHETHPWLKPKRPQLGPRAVAISRSQVDTAPRMPCAAKMDMPIGLPTSMSPSPMSTSSATRSTAMAIRLPRRPLPRLVAAIQRREAKGGVSSSMGQDCTSSELIQPPKLPAALQIPDLPDITLEKRNGAGIRAPRPALLMKPL